MKPAPPQAPQNTDFFGQFLGNPNFSGARSAEIFFLGCSLSRANTSTLGSCLFATRALFSFVLFIWKEKCQVSPSAVKSSTSSHFGILSPLRDLSSSALGSKALPKAWSESFISVFMYCSTFFILAANCVGVSHSEHLENFVDSSLRTCEMTDSCGYRSPR